MRFLRTLVLLAIPVGIFGGCIYNIKKTARKRADEAEAGELKADASGDTAPPAGLRDPSLRGGKTPPVNVKDPERQRKEEVERLTPVIMRVNTISLRQARKAHAAKLLKKGPAPQRFTNRVPDGVTRVTYRSEGRELLAWLARPQGRGPFPAVLYAHGGWALGAGDFEEARAFVDEGFAVLLPAWRGENGNPGHFEMYYGEVDDARAALAYLAAVPGVDAKRLYAAGHSAGGSLVMLLAELSPRLCKAAACGGFPDMHFYVLLKKQNPFGVAPFDWQDPAEADLRSPRRYVKDLHCPLALYFGEEDKFYLAQAKMMKIEAENTGKQVVVETIPGAGHSSALGSAIRQMIPFFNQE